MTAVAANDLTIEYETFGDPGSPPVLLTTGVTCQLIQWDTALCQALADAGFYVVRYDNRDVGLSSWLDGLGQPDLAGLLAGTGLPPYTLSDMAADSAGLLDALGLDSAHIVGLSMGGMIAQTFAIEHPGRVRTLVSIMSTTGSPSVGQPQPEALAALLAPAPTTRNEAVALAVSFWRDVSSPGYPFREQDVRALAEAGFDRAFHPDGNLRQMAAIVVQPDRTADLAGLQVPTLVIHGDADPLVDPSGGRATAAAIPGAQLMLISGMGHDLPPELFDRLVTDLTKHFRQA
jgi:pimeloyl-ACP methyl ester carboxylesterase